MISLNLSIFAFTAVQVLLVQYFFNRVMINQINYTVHNLFGKSYNT